MDYKVTDSQLSSIADAIRTKGSTSSPLAFPDGFVSAISSIPSGSSAVLISKTISSNGEYSANADGADGYFHVAVDVATSATFSDITILSNGSYSASNYNVDGFSNVVVSVSGGGGGGQDNDTLLLMVGREGTSDTLNYTGSNIAPYVAWSNAQIKKILASNVVNVGNAAFRECPNVEEIYIGACTNIGQEAFASCYNLSYIDVSSCESIKSYAFQNCKKLVSISLPNCEYIGFACFSSCIALESISLPLTTVVSNSAFLSCSKLSLVVLNSVTQIGNNAFQYCSRLESIFILASSVCSLSSIGAFYNTPIYNSGYLGHFGSIYVPSSLYNSYLTARNWSDYSSRFVSYVEGQI